MRLMRFTFLVLAALLAASGAHAQIAFRGAASAGVASGPLVPTFQAAGTAAGGTGTATPSWPAHAIGDVALLFVESTGGQPATLSTAAGFVAVASSPQSTGAGTAGTQITVYWARATSTTMAAPTVADPGNHVYAQILTYRGVIDTGNPWDVTGGGVKAAASTSVTVSGVTTTEPNTLVVQAVARDNDSAAAAFSAQANANLTGIAERSDAGTASGNGGGFAVWDGAKATPGATGNTTATVTSSINAFLTVALIPAQLTINLPVGTASGDLMVAAIAVRPSSVNITPPAGWSAQAAALQNASGNSSRQQIFYRVAGGAEPASYTWLFDSAHTGAVGGIVSYSGVDTAAPFDAFGGNLTPQGGDSNLQHRALAVTTTVADAMVISTHSFTSADTWTPPAGTTERVDAASQATPNAVGVALEINSVLQPVAGSTGDKVATAAGNGDTGSATLMALRPLVAQPVLQWTMDQATWNGTAGEVIDSSGNGLNGRAVNGTLTANTTPAISGSPGTCRYGAFDGVNDYVEVASNALLNITDELTVMMWLRPTAYPTAGNLKSFMSKDNNYEAHLNSAGKVDWWWGGGAQELISAASVPLNTWTHVAIVYSRAGGFQRIYLNGVQDTNTNNQTAALATNALPFQIGGDQGFAGREWPGQVDEVYVFRSALSQARVQQYMNSTRACASAINHFAISHAGSGVGCVDQPITFTAHDAAHAAVDANALTVNLSTTNASGTWTGIQAGGGTLNDPVAGDGAASYTFAVGSNSVTLLFRYSSLSATTETFGFNISGGGYSETTGTASGSDDPPFTMAQAGFRLRNLEDANETLLTQISGKPSNTGWNARTYRLQAINTNTSSGACTSVFASLTRAIDLGAECNSPAACAARQVSVNGANIATSANNGGAGAAAYTGVSLTFNASSEADVVLAYPDAGLISLHARYDLNPLVAGYEMIGSSNSYVVRPFGLAFPGVSHGSTATGTLIGAAGDNFSMTVQGYQWANGEDANADGVPDAAVNITDNGTVPNFSATATVGRNANLPGVALGTVSRGATCVSAATIALSGGTATAADWCYSEAGNVLLTADVTNYLAAGVNITGSSGLDGVAGGGYVGRFRPKSFVVTGTPTLANRSALVCAPASSFTYMGEGLSLGFTLEARNTQNALTQNYTGAYARLNLATAASLGIGARSGAANLTPRVDSSVVPAGSFSNGSGSLTVTTGVRRASPDNPDGPYAAAQFGIAPNDADGVQMQSLNQDVDGVGGNDHFAVAPTTELRFGRLRLANGYGPVSNGLQLPLDLQYWNGSSFAVNTSDSCTTLARANIALAFSGVIAPCNTAVLEPSLAFSSGQSTLTLAAPGTGKTGTAVLTPQLGTAAGTYCPSVGAGAAATTASAANYLLGRWDDASNPDGNANTAYDDKPSGRASFGLYGSPPKNFIFFRENY
jgi:Family of unknown function (DUF6701)/Concanavalin A-like lectin/glucanases superfamily